MNHSYIDIRLLLFFGVSVMLLLFVSFLLIFIFSQRKKYEYQRRVQVLQESQNHQLIEAAIRSEEKERHRIAESLHDEVGALLSSSKLYLQAVAISDTDPQSVELYNKGKELLNEAITHIREISHNLHSGILQQLGLNEAIRHFTDKMLVGNIMQISTDLDDSVMIRNHENAVSIYRLILELLNNIIKHAQATRLHLHSVCKDHLLKLSIVHNGEGLDQKQYEDLRFQKNGLGIKNIQNRIILLKGHILFSKEGDQYCIVIQIPINF